MVDLMLNELLHMFEILQNDFINYNQISWVLLVWFYNDLVWQLTLVYLICCNFQLWFISWNAFRVKALNSLSTAGMRTFWVGILIKLVIFPLAPAVTTAGNLAKTRIKLQVSGKMYFGQLQLVAAVGSVACVVYQRETDLAAGETVIAHHQHHHNRVDYPMGDLVEREGALSRSYNTPGWTKAPAGVWLKLFDCRLYTYLLHTIYIVLYFVFLFSLLFSFNVL